MPSDLAYVENDLVNWSDPEGLTKGGKQHINGNHPLVDGVSKKSSQSQIDAAIQRITKALKNGNLTASEKGFLQAWLKVAKRGFKFGAGSGAMLELMFPDDLNANEVDELNKSALPNDCKK